MLAHQDVCHAAQLTDNNLTNGEIRFCSGTSEARGTPAVKGLQVIAPRNRVDYGFARLLGVQAARGTGTRSSTCSQRASR